MKYLQISRRLSYKGRAFCQKSPTDSDKVEPVIMIHGGAGPIFDDLIISKVECIKAAAKIGYKALVKGRAIDGVEQALRFMESSGHFNTGKGALLNEEGNVEIDAIIMTGNLEVGVVSCVQNFENPSSLARMVMEKTQNTMMSCDGVVEFAKSQNVKIEPSSSLVCERSRKLLLKPKLYDGREVGIAGILAIDQNGNMAAGSSSGGTNGKTRGRAGDTCIPGCAVYTDNSIASVAVTGDCVSIIKTCLAYAILDNIEDGLSPSEAIQKGLFNMDMRLHGTGGAIALTKNGGFGFYFNSKRMPWAFHTATKLHYGIEKGEHNVEDSIL